MAMTALLQAVNDAWTSRLQTRTDAYLLLLHDDLVFRRLLLRMDEGNGPFQAACGSVFIPVDWRDSTGEVIHQ